LFRWSSLLGSLIVAALDAGAFDYIACPPDAREIDRIMTSALNEHSPLVAKAAPAP